MDKSHITPNVDTKVEALNELSKKLGGANSAGNFLDHILIEDGVESLYLYIKNPD